MSLLGQKRRRLLAVAIAALAAVLAVAACGSSEESKSSSGGGGESSASTKEGGAPIKTIEGSGYLEASSSRPTGLGLRPGEGPNGAERQKKAEEAGKEAAEQAGGKVKLPKVKIGIINYLGGTESSDRIADEVIYGASQLGWETVYCDGKGEPTKFVECGMTLLAQGVGAITAVAIEAGQIRPVLVKAQQMKVPVIQVAGGEVPAIDGMEGSYGPNEHKAGSLLAEAMLERLDKLPGTPEIAVHNFPANWGKDRTAELIKALKGQSKVKLATEVVTNLTNLVGFTREETTHQLAQYANLKAIWYTYDVTAQVGGQVVSQKFPGKEYPEKPMVGSFHADLQTLADIRKGLVTIDSEVDYTIGCWEALNEIAEHLARKQEISKKNQPTYAVIGDPFTYSIVTKANLPPEGQYVQPKWDVDSYFISKWHNEFTE